MWNYEKRLQYPINIKTPNAKLAQFIMSQYGGPDGEISASLRYLSQRFSMPNRMAAAVLNDVGTSVSKLLMLFFYKGCFQNLCFKKLLFSRCLYF